MFGLNVNLGVFSRPQDIRAGMDPVGYAPPVLFQRKSVSLGANT